MGYTTCYNLTWEPEPGFQPPPNCAHKAPAGAKFCPDCGASTAPLDADDVVERYLRTNENMRYALGTDGQSGDSCKWYDHEEDMRKMSKAIRNVLFTLHGEGEDAGDIWGAYFLNGKAQKHKAQIVVAPMDPKGWK